MAENVSHNTNQDCNENILLCSQSFIEGKNLLREQIGLKEMEDDLRIRGTSEIILVIGMKPQ